MELFFPMIGVLAVAVATVAATACILVPGPKHLVRRVFFGTIGFIFGGAVCSLIATIIFAMTLDSLLPNFRSDETIALIFEAVGFVSFGYLSGRVTLKFTESVLESLSRKRNPPIQSESFTAPENAERTASEGSVGSQPSSNPQNS